MLLRNTFMQMKIDFPVMKGKRYLTIATRIWLSSESVTIMYQLCNFKGNFKVRFQGWLCLGITYSFLAANAVMCGIGEQQKVSKLC